MSDSLAFQTFPNSNYLRRNGLGCGNGGFIKCLQGQGSVAGKRINCPVPSFFFLSLPLAEYDQSHSSKVSCWSVLGQRLGSW